MTITVDAVAIASDLAMEQLIDKLPEHRRKLLLSEEEDMNQAEQDEYTKLYDNIFNIILAYKV
jgi:hypothetical protein